MCTNCRIDKLHTTAYHPADNGACELFNQTIKTGLKKMLNEKCLEEWDVVLSEVMFAANTSFREQLDSLLTVFCPVWRHECQARFR